ncbi:MAG: acyl-CoA dehydrogenase family protein, partial [Planctomycetota bacterium]
MAAIDELLHKMKEMNASDLHLKPGVRPRYRILGELQDVPGTEPLSREEVEVLTREILTEEQERIRRLAHEFAEREIRPVAAHYDETEEMPWPVLEKAARVG